MSKIVEQVNHPSHYNSGKIEVIDFIEDQKLDFCLGNVVKYICRAGKKSASIYEDLSKAKWYLEHEISKYEPTLEALEVNESLVEPIDDAREWRWRLDED